MSTYTRLGSYLLASELSVDAVGRVSRGLTLSGSSFDRHYLIRTFSEELMELGLGRLSEAKRVVELLAGTRGYGANYHIELGKTPFVACDHIPGRSLAQVLQKTLEEQIPLGVDHALSVLQGMAQSILQLHGKGVHHGILSPHSVWVSYEGATHILDAPFAAVLHGMLPKAPALAAGLAPYRDAAATTPLQQDLYALGSVLYELLTLDKLPSGAIPAALAAATLKAAQEEAPLPAEILHLLNRLLLLAEPFDSAAAFNAELEKVLYDGEYSPTTFNMAFFMHTLFREESDADTQAMKLDQSADFSPFLSTGTGTATMLEDSGNSNVMKYSIIGGSLLALAFGGMVLWNVSNGKRNAELQNQIVALQREGAANDAKLLDLNKAQEEAKLKEVQLTKAATEGKTAEDRAKAKKELEETKVKADLLARERDEALKKRQEITERTQTIAQAVPQPVPVKVEAPKPAVTTTPVAAPVAAPAPAAQARVQNVETPAAISHQAIPVTPRVKRDFLPPNIRGAAIKLGLKVYVDEQGNPLKVIFTSPVESHYNDAAQAAAMASTYTPATKNGKPTKGWVNLDYNFPKPQ